jgi:hypothetical protein
LEPASSAALRNGIPVLEDKFRKNRVTACDTLESQAPLIEILRDSFTGNEPDPGFAETGRGITETDALFGVAVPLEEVWSDVGDMGEAIRIRQAAKPEKIHFLRRFSIPFPPVHGSLRRKAVFVMRV